MRTAHLDVEDLGFRWGLGVFETIRVQEGVALFHQMHLESLAEAAEALGLAMPDESLWRKAPEGDGVWRWFLTPQMQSDSWQPGLETLPEHYSLSLSPLRIDQQSWEARYKTLSYLLRHQARKEASTDEVVLLNQHGHVASAAMANLFWVRQGKLYTPALESGCRDGVLRRWLEQSWAGEWEEGHYQVAELDLADEIFVTNSRIGVMPVHLYQGKQLSVGSVTKHLKEQYRETLSRQLMVHS
jgi:4-amino-4-deoxychorismate lyase